MTPTVYGEISPAKASHTAGQLWAFTLGMNPGDLVVVPRKASRTIAVGEITSAYRFEAKARDAEHHSRSVRWLRTDVPRATFAKDLLFSFGAMMTICEIKRNDAERRVRALIASGWKPERAIDDLARPKSGAARATGSVDDEAAEAASTNLEELARDQIAEVLRREFTGHELAALIDGILKAQGYVTFMSPPGPDKGVDILAAPGPLGFGHPRICVQVKSGDSAVDRPTLDQLIGTMQNVHADQALLVSWGGFKSSVEREVATQFFRVRLWNADDVITQLLDNYDRLSEEIRAELPLKRIWVVTPRDGEEGDA